MKLIYKLIEEANQRYSSQYSGTLANHLPMTLFALDHLGADDAAIRRFYQRYIKRLAAKPTQTAITLTPGNWSSYLGRDKYHQDYLDYFTGQMQQSGVEKTLHTHLSMLCTGVAGGAFHGLIRLSYALESGQENEIAEALGYWAISFLDLQANPEQRPRLLTSFSETLANLHNQFAGTMFDAPNIAVRMASVRNTSEFSALVKSLDPDSLNLEDLAKTMATALCQTRHFTILHGVTATQAMRVVSTYLPHPQTSLYYFAHALAAAYVTTGAPKIEPVDPATIIVDWDRVKGIAVRSLDDHIPKITYSGLKEYQTYSHPIFFEATRRYLERD